MTRNDQNQYDRADAVLDELIGAYRRGDSVAAIARAHGLRREVVAGALMAEGILPTSPAGEAVRKYVRDHPGLSVDDLAAQLSLSKSTVSRCLRGAPERNLVVSLKVRDRSTYSDDQLFEALRTAWALLGDERPHGLTRVKYTTLMGAVSDPPAAQTFMLRWGSWSRACELAGISAANAKRSVYEKAWSNDDIIGAVSDFVAATGQTTARAYEAWARANRRPSLTLLVQRLGRWSEARKLALALRDDPPADTAHIDAAATRSATHEVREGRRTLRFEGAELAAATSYRPGAKRWIEFGLHRTDAGSYVVSRVGETRVYHLPTCGTAARAGLASTARMELPAESEPCDDCRPDLSATPVVAVESPRYWAQVISSAEGVVVAVHKTDRSGARYLTGVAARLLDKAAENSPAIEAAYRVTNVA